MGKTGPLVKAARGVVTNAPYTITASGYGFVETIDGVTVYCPEKIVTAAGMSGADIGTAANVHYIKVPDGKYVATRVDVLRKDAQLGLQPIVDKLLEIESLLAELYTLLEDRGCTVPDFEAE